MKKLKATDRKWMEKAKDAAMAASVKNAGGEGWFDRADVAWCLGYPDRYKVRPSRYGVFDEALNGLVKAGVLEARPMQGGTLWRARK